MPRKYFTIERDLFTVVDCCSIRPNCTVKGAGDNFKTFISFDSTVLSVLAIFKLSEACIRKCYCRQFTKDHRRKLSITSRSSFLFYWVGWEWIFFKPTQDFFSSFGSSISATIKQDLQRNISTRTMLFFEPLQVLIAPLSPFHCLVEPCRIFVPFETGDKILWYNKFRILKIHSWMRG